MKKKIVILGAGGFAREVYWHLQSQYSDFVFVDDTTDLDYLCLKNTQYPIIKNWDFSSHRDTDFIVGVGIPKIKKLMVEKAIKAGLNPAETFVHPSAVVQDVKLGKGGVIAPNCVLTTNIVLGDYVVLNLACTVGHDSVLHDFVTANPGSCISGNVVIGAGSLLGVGSSIREKINICENTTLGAQAAVVSDIVDSGVYVGIPAKKLIR